MSKEIELLEQIKKQEDTSDKKVKDAQTKAEKIVEEARRQAGARLEEARLMAEKNHVDAMKNAAKDSDESSGEIIADANTRAQSIKRVERATLLTLFKKSIKERFGV